MDEIDVGFLVVGHTHCSIDQYFSTISNFLKSRADFVPCPAAMRHLLTVAHHDEAKRPDPRFVKQLEVSASAIGLACVVTRQALCLSFKQSVLLCFCLSLSVCLSVCLCVCLSWCLFDCIASDRLRLQVLARASPQPGYKVHECAASFQNHPSLEEGLASIQAVLRESRWLATSAAS